VTAALAPDAPEAGLSARGVTVTYRNGVTALTNASFAIPRGTIAALGRRERGRQIDAVQGDHGLSAAVRRADHHPWPTRPRPP
jgi:hypothetical protein